MLLVGIPVLGLVGILEAGRGLSVPPAVSGEWKLEFDNATCATLASLRQPALSISQSGVDAMVTLNDGKNGGRGTVFEAGIEGDTLQSSLVTASITGKRGERAMQGTLAMDGCPPVAFHATRQAPPKSAK